MESLIFGAVASSALVLGALAGARIRLPKAVLAGMLAFAAGALITALSFELFEDAYERGGIWRAALGLIVGATVFTFLSRWLDRLAQGRHEEAHGQREAGPRRVGPRPTRLDGVHLGCGRPRAAGRGDARRGAGERRAGRLAGEGTGGLALLAAIFVSNFPEALVGSASMRAQGRSHRFVLGTWTVCAVLLTLAVVLGAGPLSSASAETISLPLAFAAGAVLASLADTLMPEAYEKGGPLVALSTTAGFVLSFVLATL